MSRRLWICPECGSITASWANDLCLACECEIEECDKQYLPDEEDMSEYPEEEVEE